METKPLARLYTNDELVAMTGLSRVTLWRMRREGKLPYHKLRQGVFYTQEDVQAFLDNTASGAQTADS